VVQSLGEYINDDNTKIRARAVTYLTATISALSPTFLTRQQVQVLTDFLSARIEDGGAVEGLSKLQASSRFTKDMAQSVAKA
jgi:DNA repair/transcription protein MET18/MMS19